ncbi:MAG TPA: sugar porter family MFS transporter [Pseudonocardiaceae bacterium]|nr:sugar porter family MFS transporter [Pseudonocardiaceae bacterium]
MPGFLGTVASGGNRFVLRISLVAAIGGFLFGYDTGVISGALLYIAPQLHAGTLAQSWIVGGLLLGAVVGACLAGYLADAISRKWTKFAAGVVYTLAAVGSAFAQSTGELIIARTVLGLAVGTASFVAPMYIAEQTPPRIRGGTVSFNQLMITSGILLAYVADFALKGVAGNWRWMLGLGAVPGVALVIGMLLVPHTPRWLMQRDRGAEARAVLTRSRPAGQVDGELDEIRSVLRTEGRRRLRDVFGSGARAALVVGLGLAVFQQLVGVNTVIYFSPTILTYTGLHANSAVTEALTVGITNVVFTVIAILLLDRVGRRVLLLIGTVGLSVALVLLGLFFALPDLRQHAPWLALVALLVFIASFAIGLGPVFWLMISEVFPLSLRSRAMAVCTAANWIANFLVSYFFLQLIGAAGRPATFWIYAGLGVLAVVFFAVRVPETKDRSLEQIEHDIGAHPRLSRAA